VPHASKRGREARRIQERRKAWRDIVLLLLAASVVIGAAFLWGLHNRRPAVAPAAPIDGIPCAVEQGNYHEHAHLAILDAGRTLRIPTSIGHGPSGCLYWLHVHASDPSGLIHIEAPYRIVPTLGTFFDVWGQPLSRRRVWTLDTSLRQRLKVYLNQTLHSGDPRLIELHPHTTVTIEVGPPFPTPSKYKFESGY
jgi:hypothetical protein